MHDKSLILATLPVETDLIPASTYLKLLDQCANGDVGACDIVELCKSGRSGWQKILKEADRTLTYDAKESIQDVARGGAALTPGSILDFDAIVTTTRKDRDGDILETGGAHFDPRSPLLWAHNPDLPIGKTITITTHTKNVLAGRFCIFNTELGRDAAILVEGGALRISHGFEPTEFEPLEGKNAGRWRILKFQIFEVSLVSVPSNIDAVITGFEKGKFESGIVKSWGKRLLDARPVQGIGMDLKSSHGNCSCHEGSGAAEPKGVVLPQFKAGDELKANDLQTISDTVSALVNHAEKSGFKGTPIIGSGAVVRPDGRLGFPRTDALQTDALQTDKEPLLRSKFMQIDTKEAPGEGQGEQQEHPEDRERFGQGAQAGDEAWQPIDGPGKSLGGPEEEDSDDGDDDDDLDKDNPPPSVKAGRAISAKNRAKLEEVSGHLSYVIGMDGTHASSQCKTMIKAAKTHVDEMLSEPPEDDRGNESVGALNDPNMYDAAKLAGMLMLKADELDPEIAGSLIDALEKRMEFAANEITAELIGNL